jgi:hypothetical protein
MRHHMARPCRHSCLSGRTLLALGCPLSRIPLGAAFLRLQPHEEGGQGGLGVGGGGTINQGNLRGRQPDSPRLRCRPGGCSRQEKLLLFCAASTGDCLAMRT